MTDLLSFMVEVTRGELSPLLAADAAWCRHPDSPTGWEPALERALLPLRTLAGHLLELGRSESLSKADGDALEGLLQQPARSRTYYQNREGCVAP